MNPAPAGVDGSTSKRFEVIRTHKEEMTGPSAFGLRISFGSRISDLGFNLLATAASNLILGPCASSMFRSANAVMPSRSAPAFCLGSAWNAAGLVWAPVARSSPIPTSLPDTDAPYQRLYPAGFLPTLITLPAGETAKSLRSVEACYDQLASHRLERKSFIVALGGGVVGDLAGFVAATYLRGMPSCRCRPRCSRRWTVRSAARSA